MADLEFAVDPDSGAGFDYASLNAFEADQQQDLTDAGGDTMTAKCRSTGGTADTTATTFAGWTTADANDITVWTDTGESYRHAGVWPTGNQYEITVTATSAITINEHYVRLIGLAIGGSAGAGTQWIVNTDSTSNGLLISHCLIRRLVAAGNGNVGIRLQGSGITRRIYNNIFYDIPGAVQGYAIHDLSGSGSFNYIYNNTFHNVDRAVEADNGARSLLKNNIVNDSEDDFAGSFDATSTHNVTNETPDANNAFGATHEAAKTTDGTEASKLVDSSETFPNVIVGNIVENTTDATYTYVTSIAEAGSGKLGVNDDIFVSGEGYNVYTNIFGAVTFENEGADDFHLGAGDTVAMSNGADLDADANINVTDDIDSDARHATTPDIGADEFVVVAADFYSGRGVGRGVARGVYR